jgi:Raf kinase inhibitor-like YbhB/YbcL family protein
LTVVANMKLVSKAFVHGGAIPSKYTCDGADISPEITFSEVPSRAVTLVLIVEDPDIPMKMPPDNKWNHWIVWNIPADTRTLAEGSTPPGVQGRGTNGKSGYGGPCPPDREHRYIFTAYAIDRMINLPLHATKQDVIAAIQSHILDKAELIGRYKRIHM